MTITVPDNVSALGNVVLSFYPSFTAPNLPTTTELNGASRIRCGDFMMPDWGGLTGDQSTGTDRRFHEKIGRERLGSLIRALEALTYTYLPQALSSDAANKMKTALAMGTKGYFVIAYGKDPTTTFAIGNIVTILAVEAGYQRKNSVGSDEFSPLTITQKLSVYGSVYEDVTIAA